MGSGANVGVRLVPLITQDLKENFDWTSLMLLLLLELLTLVNI